MLTFADHVVAGLLSIAFLRFSERHLEKHNGIASALGCASDSRSPRTTLSSLYSNCDCSKSLQLATKASQVRFIVRKFRCQKSALKIGTQKVSQIQLHKVSRMKLTPPSRRISSLDLACPGSINDSMTDLPSSFSISCTTKHLQTGFARTSARFCAANI